MSSEWALWASFEPFVPSEPFQAHWALGLFLKFSVATPSPIVAQFSIRYAFWVVVAMLFLVWKILSIGVSLGWAMSCRTKGPRIESHFRRFFFIREIKFQINHASACDVSRVGYHKFFNVIQ